MKRVRGKKKIHTIYAFGLTPIQGFLAAPLKSRVFLQALIKALNQTIFEFIPKFNN